MTDKVVNLDAVRSDLAAAREAPAAPAGGDEAKRPRRRDGLPDDCPVSALGTADGIYYYMTALRELRELAAKEHGRLQFQSLFAPRSDYLVRQWPKYAARGGREPTVVGWDTAEAPTDLMNACARMGVWSKSERVRGVGCWSADNGRLIWHVGDAVIECLDDGTQRVHMPGPLGDHVYPADGALPRPVMADVSTEVGAEILSIFRRWNWRRKDIAPVLLLGWTAAAMVGGALDWRPAIWVTGGKGTGKSTLRDQVLDHLFGAGGVVSVTDTTEGGLRQRIGQKTAPAAVDELESEADNRRAMALLRLMRSAASGGTILRGGADHRETEFVARCCFMFSSILIPPLLPQDRSRTAVLDLSPLPQGAARLALDKGRLRDMGSLLRGRIARRWADAQAAIKRYQDELMTPPAPGERPFDARGADLLGTLLGMAEVLLFDDREDRDADALGWVASVRSLAHSEVDADDSEAAVLQHLLSSIIDPYRSGERTTVATWVHRAAGHDPDYGGDEKSARRLLGAFGMAIVPARPPVPAYLAIANNHQGLAPIFAGTPWAAMPGAQPVWVQALRRLAAAWAGVECSTPKNFAGAISRAVLLPLAVACPYPQGDEQVLTLEDGESP